MPIGRYWKVDLNGFIQNDSNREFIPKKFQPIIDCVSEGYFDLLGETLESVYLTGSVSRGLHRDGESDMDFFAVLKPSAPMSSRLDEELSRKRQELIKRFPYIPKFDLEVWPHEWVFSKEKRFSIFAFVVKTHSVLLRGTDLSLQIPPFRLQPEVAYDCLSQIRVDIDEAVEEVDKNPEAAHVRYWCARISKNIIRACFGLVMMEHGRFTWDIELCSEAFLLRYPQHRPDLCKALSLARDPLESSKSLLEFLGQVSSWLIPQADEWIRKYDSTLGK